jgi:hypothetical protein
LKPADAIRRVSRSEIRPVLQHPNVTASPAEASGACTCGRNPGFAQIGRAFDRDFKSTPVLNIFAVEGATNAPLSFDAGEASERRIVDLTISSGLSCDHGKCTKFFRAV